MNKLKISGLVLLIFVVLSSVCVMGIIVESDIDEIFIEDEVIVEEGILIEDEIIEEYTIHLGEYTIQGYNIERSSAKEVSFLAFDEEDEQDVRITTQLENGDETIVKFIEIGGVVDDEGLVEGTTFVDEAYIEIDGENYFSYELYEDVSFVYYIQSDDLIIEEGRIDVGGQIFDVNREISVIGGSVYTNKPVEIEGFGKFSGKITPSYAGITLEPIQDFSGNYFGDGEDITIKQGSILIAREGFDPEFYTGSYYYETEDSFMMQTDSNTIADYTSNSGNEIIRHRNSREVFEINFEGPASVSVLNRDSEGLNPIMSIEPESVDLSYRNGAITDSGTGVLNFEEDMFNIQDEEDLFEALENKHSLPLVVEAGDQTAVYSATNSAQLLDAEGNAFLTMNDLGLPITQEIGDDIRNFDELQEKWPEIKLEVDEVFEEYGAEPSAATVQTIDYWLENEHNVMSETIVISSNKTMNGAVPSSKKIYFADALYNPDYREFSNPESPTHVVDQQEGVMGLARIYETGNFIGNPTKTLKHENTHIIIENADPSLIENYNQIGERTLEAIHEDPMYDRIAGDVAETIGKTKEEVLASINEGEYDYYQSMLELSERDEKYSGLAQTASDYEQLLSNYGVSSPYAFYVDEDYEELGFIEFATVYSELDIEEFQSGLNSLNEAERIYHNDMLQLAYDSNQIDVATCAEILGSQCRKGVLYSER